MSSRFWARLRGALAAIALGFFAASPASSDSYVGVSGGAFVPYSGNAGWTVMGELGTELSSKWVRIGLELIYADLNQQLNPLVVGQPGVEVGLRKFDINFAARYVMFPGFLSPYFGAGAGLSFINADTRQLQAALGVPPALASASTTGVGGGVFGLAGLELPLFSKRTNLFAEARVGYTWEFTDSLQPLIVSNNYSGFSGLAGVRLRF